MEFTEHILNPKTDSDLLFKLDNQCFIRDFDYPAVSAQSESEYLVGSEVYGYFSGDRPAGFFAYKTNLDGSAELMSLAVLPDFQRQGLGKRMIARFLELNAGKTLHLVVHPQNTGAVILYLKSGFTINGWNPNYYGDGQPRLLMSKVHS